MLHGLLFSTTGASWRGCQLQFTVHMTVQSVMTGTKPHQSDLLLPGQQVVVVMMMIVLMVTVMIVVMMMMMIMTDVSMFMS